MKKYRFFLHYNKPASKSLKRPVWSVHFRNKCHIVDGINCSEKTESKINKRQPYVVMQGFAKDVKVENGCAIIS